MIPAHEALSKAKLALTDRGRAGQVLVEEVIIGALDKVWSVGTRS